MCCYVGVDINIKFNFPTVRSILKSGGVNKNNNSSTTATITSSNTKTTAGNSNSSSNTNSTTGNSNGGSSNTTAVINNSTNNNTSTTTSSTQQGGYGLTPILLACHHGHSNVVRELLWRHCDCRYICAIVMVFVQIAIIFQNSSYIQKCY